MSLTIPQMLLVKSLSPTGDEELGYTILFDSRSPSMTVVDNYGYADQDDVIGSTAMQLSRGKLEGAMFRARVYDRLATSELESLRVIPGPHVLARQEFWVDYLPLIRQMVAADDSQEGKVQQSSQKRMTRNSQRYVRTIPLTDGQRKALEL